MIFNFMIYLANTDSDPLKNIKISSLSELQTFLETKNEYTQFISEKLKKDYEPKGKTQKHHIIPLSANGLDHPCNIITLSYFDHIRAHELLYEVYKRPEDQLALNFMTNDPETFHNRIKLSHQSSQRNKTGFFSTEQQTESGKKGGSTPSEKKDIKFQEKQTETTTKFLATDHTWVHKKGQTLFIKGGQFKLMRDLVQYILKNSKEPIKTTAEEKSIAGMFGKVIAKRRNSTLGWSIKK